tara:strand:+ start:1588 stop:1935 length:348 start_codon:yes stop_codon:yes gene_type:complete
MRTALIAIISSVLFLAPASIKPDLDGICVVEFNADFNKQNSVPWIEKLSECNAVRINISAEPEMQMEHKIVVVPTIIVFNEGEEVERFQANIMMTMETTKNEVQEVVDEIILSDF